ncbi:MAG: hypothetical protein ACIAXF_06115 [Phycisphaerales bacterium JB063]
MQVIGWIWILAMSFGMVIGTGSMPGVLWRGTRWGYVGLALSVAMFVSSPSWQQSNHMVYLACLVASLPFVFLLVTHYIRFVRRHRRERLCADCGYLLPADASQGNPCPECGSASWLRMPESSLETYAKSPGMPTFWIPKRLMVLLFLLTVSILGFGSEAAKAVGGRFENAHVAAGVAVAIWMASTAVAISVLVSVRRAEDLRRIERDRVEAEKARLAEGEEGEA